MNLSKNRLFTTTPSVFLNHALQRTSVWFLITVLCTTFAQANDLCSEAIEIPVSSGSFCTSMIHGDTYTATSDSIQDQCGLPGTDVWYKFTATSDSMFLTSTVTSYAFGYCDQIIAVYSGDCSNLSIISCNTGSLTNLAAGNEYYIRVACSAQIAFDICITSDPLSIGCGSFELPINYGNSCTSTTINSNNSTTIQNPPCGSLTEAIWTEFTAPHSGDFSIFLTCDDWDNFYLNAAVYDTMTCVIGGSNQIICETLFQDSILYLNNLAAGDRYHLLFLPFDNRNFEICLRTPSVWSQNGPHIFHSGGNVGINKNDPQYDLDVSGDVRITGELIADSDARFKKNIKSLTTVIPLLQSLSPKSYDFDRENFPERNFPARRSMGLLAQEVEAILPDLVRTGADGVKGINYTAFIPMLIAALQEQQQEIDLLRAQIQTTYRTEE